MLKRRMTVDDDAYILRRWWSAVAGTVPRDVVALWFNVVDLPEGQPPGRYLTVNGCDGFDPGDEAGTWWKAPVWWPTRRYVRAPQVAALADGDDQAILDTAAALVGALEPQTYVAFPLQAVAVGVDGGDFVITWSRA